MLSSKKFTWKGTLRQVFIGLASEPHTPPPKHCIRVYSILIDTGKGGELNQSKGKRGNSSQIWVENTNMTDCISSL